MSFDLSSRKHTQSSDLYKLNFGMVIFNNEHTLYLFIQPTFYTVDLDEALCLNHEENSNEPPSIINVANNTHRLNTYTYLELLSHSPL